MLSTLTFKDKTISAFYQNGRYFVLLEAASRVFFTNHPVDSFVYCVEHWLRIPVTYLTAAQELFFIEFDRLPPNALMCKKIMLFDDLTENFWRLENLFASPYNPYSQTVDFQRCDDVIGREYTTYDVSRSRPVNDDSANVTNLQSVVAADGASVTGRAKRVKKRVFSEVIEID